MLRRTGQYLKRNPSPAVFICGLVFILSLQWLMQPQAINGVYFQRWSAEDMMQTVSVVDLRAEPLASLYYLHVQPPLLDAIRAALAQLWPTVDARTLVVTGVALATSLLFGFGWLDRIWRGPSYAGGWQNFSLWQLAQSVPQVIVIGIWIIVALITLMALRRTGLSRAGLAVAAVSSNLLSPYLTGPHLLLTLCFGWGLLLDESIGWGAVAYLVSLTPLLRLTTGNQALNQFDLIFPAVVFVGLLVKQFRPARPALALTNNRRLRETG